MILLGAIEARLLHARYPMVGILRDVHAEDVVRLLPPACRHELVAVAVDLQGRTLRRAFHERHMGVVLAAERGQNPRPGQQVLEDLLDLDGGVGVAQGLIQAEVAFEQVGGGFVVGVPQILRIAAELFAEPLRTRSFTSMETLKRTASFTQRSVT